jgi:PAP2 superfamily protein
VRRSTVVRAAALTVLAAGVAAPQLRRRLGLRPPVVLAVASAAPVALCVLVPRSRARDFGICLLQMLAYVSGYKMPYDDPEALMRRVKVTYPLAVDRVLGGGVTPTLRLQRALGMPGRFRAWEKLLVWSHWLWFAFPHGTVLYLILRHPERVNRGATRIYATFDIGAIGYWAVPTAPPWYAAAEGYMKDGRTPELRRVMVEYGEQFWRSGWAPLYGVLGGNPLAAMPSLHFATSVSAAHVLAETGIAAAVLGWTYTTLLGIALVYLGEHYVVDLAVGLTLAEGVRVAAPAATPAARGFSARVQAIEAWARP